MNDLDYSGTTQYKNFELAGFVEEKDLQPFLLINPSLNRLFCHWYKDHYISMEEYFKDHTLILAYTKKQYSLAICFHPKEHRTVPDRITYLYLQPGDKNFLRTADISREHLFGSPDIANLVIDKALDAIINKRLVEYKDLWAKVYGAEIVKSHVLLLAESKKLDMDEINKTFKMVDLLNRK